MSLKDSLPGFFIEKDPSDLKDVIVVVDTSVLLSLLTCSSDYFENCYEKLNDMNSENQLFFPNHIAEEYLLNVETVSRKDGRIYASIDNIIDNCFKHFCDLKGTYEERVKDYKEIEDVIQKFSNKLKNIFKKQLDKPDYDDRVKKIEALFTNIGAPYSRKELYEIQKEIEFRFSVLIPPGFMDDNKNNGNKYGDCIIWFQLMAYAKEKKKDILYITLDVKDDWRVGGEFRRELYNEFYQETDQKIFMYDLDEFINMYESFTNQSILKEKPSSSAHKEVTLNDTLPYELLNVRLDSAYPTWDDAHLPELRWTYGVHGLPWNDSEYELKALKRRIAELEQNMLREKFLYNNRINNNYFNSIKDKIASSEEENDSQEDDSVNK